MTPTIATPPAPPRWRAVAALFSELQDGKRLAPAGVERSLADDLFVDAWRAVLRGSEWSGLATEISCRAVLNVLFPGVGATFFAAARFSEAEAMEVCERAFERTLADRIAPATRQRLAAALPTVVCKIFTGSSADAAALPDCLEALRRQPRAGATHPEHPRLVLLPPESHADHCLMTGVYASLLSERYGSDPGVAFVCGLAHHLHNAYLPDCGWAGELALEPYLERTIRNCRGRALSEIESFVRGTDKSPNLRERLTQALTHHETIATSEGKAVSAADVLDRVLDVHWRTRAAAVTDQQVLGDRDLVHPGPLKTFQTHLLNETALWTTN